MGREGFRDSLYGDQIVGRTTQYRPLEKDEDFGSVPIGIEYAVVQYGSADKAHPR
jgi:hypothetical protein